MKSLKQNRTGTAMRRRQDNRRLRGNGFTLVEILIVVIILGILAAVVIPQFSNASATSRNDALLAQLHSVRTAITAYKLDHMDTWPDLSSGWNSLLVATNAQGTTTGDTPFGPYLPSAPINAVSGGSSVSRSAAAGVDWVYVQSTGTLIALDGQGNPFNETP